MQAIQQQGPPDYVVNHLPVIVRHRVVRHHYGAVLRKVVRGCLTIRVRHYGQKDRPQKIPDWLILSQHSEMLYETIKKNHRKFFPTFIVLSKYNIQLHKSVLFLFTTVHVLINQSRALRAGTNRLIERARQVKRRHLHSSLAIAILSCPNCHHFEVCLVLLKIFSVTF